MHESVAGAIGELASYELKLSNSSKTALIDDEDFIKIIFKAVYLGAHGYVYVGHSRRLHHLILDVDNFDTKEVHHINGNKLDNRKANLAYITFLEHQGAQGKLRNNKSGFKGVSWKNPQGTKRGKWIAQIGHNKTRIHLGRFDTAEEAARAYDRAAFERYGNYAYLNFPKSCPQPVSFA